MVDVAYSNERAAIYDFNKETVFNNWGVIYCAHDGKVASFTDLEGKRVAVMNGSIHTEGDQGIKALLKGFNINCTFVGVASYDEVFRTIDSDMADAGV